MSFNIINARPRNSIILLDAWKDMFLLKQSIEKLNVENIIWSEETQTFFFQCSYYEEVLEKKDIICFYLTSNIHPDIINVIKSGRYVIKARIFIFKDYNRLSYVIFRRALLKLQPTEFLAPKDVKKNEKKYNYNKSIKFEILL
jgi:hypothetical protein